MFECNSVDIKRGDNQVLCGLNIKTPSKGLFFVIGKNGCGKSTLLQLFSGEIDPAVGSVKKASATFLLGSHPWAHGALSGSDLGDILKIHLLENIVRALDAKRLLKSPLGDLSAGERQRVWLTIALSSSCPSILLDEPTSYLDLEHLENLAGILNETASSKLIGVATHEFNWLLKSGESEVFLLDQGRITCRGESTTVLGSKEFESAFNLRSCLTDNPLETGKILVTSRINNDE